MERQQEHDKAVVRIQDAVKTFHKAGRKFRVYHGSTSSTRSLDLQRDSMVDTSDMARLFPVDKATMTVKAEPKVAMDELAAHTLKHGLVPKIVMEFKGITCGGGYSGMSAESSMFRYGLFQNTVSEIEIVLGDGTLETASRKHNADLLEHAGGSLGTFGIVTLLTIELIEASKYIELDVRRVSDVATVHQIFEKSVLDDSIDYIDGIFFRPDLAVTMFGRMISSPPKDKPVLGKKEIHWFADHIEKLASKQPLPQAGAATPAGTTVIYLTLWDYLFRYDHGAFWGGKLAFQHFHIPQNRLTKKLADPFLDSRTCYHAMHKTGLANEYLVQDFGIPVSGVVDFINYVNKELPHLQVFLAPCQSAIEIGVASRFSDNIREVKDQRVYAAGVYGRGPKDPAAFVEMNRKLEVRASELRGSKLLYARTYYTEQEFWDIYDKQVYDEMRSKYRATTLPNVYEKLHADMSKRVKSRPIRGVIETVFDKATGRKDYLLKGK